MNGYISIKDLLAEYVRKFWIMIICVIIGIILFLGIKYINSRKSIEFQEDKTQNEVVLEEIISSLSETEINVVNYYVAQMKIYSQQEEYMKNSIYFHLDANEVYVTNMQYYLSAQSKEDMDNIMVLYNTYLKRGGVWSDLCEKNTEWSPEYLSEIIKFECADISNYNYPSVINVTIYQQDREQSIELVEEIKNIMSKFKEICSDVGLNHTLTIVSQNMFETSDSNISRNQKDYISAHKNLGTELDGLKENFNSTQLYIAELELNPDFDSESILPLDSVESNEQVFSIGIKDILLGTVIGCFLALCMISAGYIFTGTIKISDEIGTSLQIPKLGVLVLKDKNIFEKLADKIFYKNDINTWDKEVKLIVSKICMLDKKEVAFVGTVSESAGKQVQEVRENLLKRGIHTKVVTEICNEANDFEVAKKAENVIFIETLRKSESAKIYNKVRLCEEHHINILGYIILDI